VIGAILLWLVLRELKIPGSWVARRSGRCTRSSRERRLDERAEERAGGVFFFGSILAFLRSSMGTEGRATDARRRVLLAVALYAARC
jgi:hypothetical protein